MDIIILEAKSNGYPNAELISRYAHQCNTIVELGSGSLSATWSLLLGKPGHVWCVDQQTPNPQRLDQLKKLSKVAGIEVVFIRANVLTLDLASFPSIDLLFIDTWHVYGQLKRELRRYAPLVRHYILIPNTEIDKWFGESLRAGSNTREQADTEDWPLHEVHLGMKAAIEEFCTVFPTWREEAHFSTHYGLTILSNTTFSPPSARI